MKADFDERSDMPGLNQYFFASW